MTPRLCKFYSECHQSAVYRIPHSHLALCKDHFNKNFEKRVVDVIHSKKMFAANRNEKLLLALSGGKDSQVLLYVLDKLYGSTLNIEAIYIDLGISDHDYSHQSGIIAQEFCERLNHPFHSINVKERYGISIDDISWTKAVFADHEWEVETDPFRGECSYCGAFKRYLINRFATQHNFSVVATGHNLTDEATALVNNFFNMNIMFLSRPGPVINSQVETMVPRVKPFFFISEEEIMMYAYFNQIPHFPAECPYSLQSPNLKLKRVLNNLEQHRRGNLIGLMHKYYKYMQPVIAASTIFEKSSTKICKTCQGSAFGTRCSFCRMLDRLLDRYQQAQTAQNS